MKKLIFILTAICLFMSCSFITDSEDNTNYCEPNPCLNGSECIASSGTYTCTCQDNYFGSNCENYINPLVGTWNLTTILYFETLDCSGNPLGSTDVNSLEQLAVFGVDEYNLKITITVDSYIIGINTISSDTSDVREEYVSTGIILDHGDQYCVIWDTGDGDECDECRDYIVNGDEVELTSYNCPLPLPPHPNVPCQIYTFVKQ